MGESCGGACASGLETRRRRNDAHLLLQQQPASQPRVVLDELLVAQAVLHRSGYVTHPSGCRSARSAISDPEPAQAPAGLRIDTLNAKAPGRCCAGELASQDGCGRWRMIQQLPWQPHPCHGRGWQRGRGGGGGIVWSKVANGATWEISVALQTGDLWWKQCEESHDI